MNITSIRDVFKGIKTTGLKLTIGKSYFGVTQVEYLGRTSIQRNSAARSEGQNLLLQSPFPEIKETSTKIYWHCELLSKLHTTLSEKLIGMYELLKADAKITVSEELVNNFKENNASPAEACRLALRQAVAGTHTSS